MDDSRMTTIVWRIDIPFCIQSLINNVQNLKRDEAMFLFGV